MLMRNHCCAVDPSASDCAMVDCSASRYGKCVPKYDCEDDDYFFNEFNGRCEFKYIIPCEEFYDWDASSRMCETYNYCD